MGATGQAARAVMEEAHARVCEQGQWVLNEKRLLTVAGLDGVQADFAQGPREPAALASWLEAVAAAISG